MTLEAHEPRRARRAPGASILRDTAAPERNGPRAPGAPRPRIPAHPATRSGPTGKAEPPGPAPPRPGEGKGAAALAAAHPPPRWMRPGSLRKNSPQHHCAQQFPMASCWPQLLLPPGGLRPPRPWGGAAADPRQQRAGTASWLRRDGRCSPRPPAPPLPPASPATSARPSPGPSQPSRIPPQKRLPPWPCAVGSSHGSPCFDRRKMWQGPRGKDGKSRFEGGESRSRSLL